jgi:alkylation response protein AidB-like acyl-CoA dehydrogenase
MVNGYLMAFDAARPDIDGHPMVIAAQRLARDLLAPAAARVDATSVPPSHLLALAEAGLLGLNGPIELGGAPPAVLRAVSEILAGADATTWFVESQHQTAVQLLARSDCPTREQKLGPLIRGEMMSGLAFAHVRRPNRPVRVQQVKGGWQFDGEVPWYTGWGLMDVMLIAGTTDSNEVVYGFAPSRASECVRASEPLRLAAMQGSLTVRLSLKELLVPDQDVVMRVPYQEWAASDRLTRVNASPACFGIAQAALQLLATHRQPAAADCAARLRERLMAIRSECYRLIDEVPADEALAERLSKKVDAFGVMIEATTALVTAKAGAGMIAEATPQRLAREALFMLVLGQTEEVRRATLDYWGNHRASAQTRS